MAGTIVADQLQDGAGNSTSMDNAIYGSAKAWVNFNGTVATPSTIRASYNVSSITKNGTGDYTVNFTNAFADSNYVMAGSSSATAGANFAVWTYSMATTNIRVQAGNYAAYADGSIMSVSIFR